MLKIRSRFATANPVADMTNGNILAHIFRFSVPLLIGNLFQQLYNTVDSVVVGNYVGKEALAAVGSVGPMANVLIGVFSGFATGGGIVIANYYGAGKSRQVHDAVQTIILVTGILSLLLPPIGIVLIPTLLNAVHTPDEIFSQSADYLLIYFSGLPGLLFYNTGSGILRAIGDSRRPLYFLIFSAVLNTILDIWFVAYWHMGVIGVAVATILAQFCSAILVLFVLTNCKGSYKIDWKGLRIYPQSIKLIFTIGLPVALQMAITAFSNLFVQSYINCFGSDCMAGWTAYNKIDSFASLPVTSLSLAITTFAGQNLGAGKNDRIRKGTYISLLSAEVISVILFVPMIIFAPLLVSAFNQDPAVIEYGSLFVRAISPFYLILAINQIISGVLNGLGDTKNCMLITLGSYVLFRQIYLLISYQAFPSIYSVMFGYPAGWVLGTILTAWHYHKNFKRNALN